MCFSLQVDTDLKKISRLYQAQINEKAFEYFHQHKTQFHFKEITHNRLFAKTWCPLMIQHKGRREFRPMRYQLLPSFSPEEIYTRINPKTQKKQEIKNTFNARLDGLLNQKTKAFQKPFLFYHGVLVAHGFYEWVPDPENPKKTKTIYFHHENHEPLLISCLFDTWTKQENAVVNKIIQSFAVITTDPTPEVAAMGHDRSPIFLNSQDIDRWLNCESGNRDDFVQLLTKPNTVRLKSTWDF